MISSPPSPPESDVSPAEAAQELLRRRRARRSLLDFATYTMPDYSVSWHHRLICDYLDRFARGEIARLILNLPPRHGKSELASRRLPAYLLGRNPDLRIIACSHTASLAEKMNRDVQRVLDGQEYRRLFPDTQLSTGNIRTVAGAPLRNSEMFEVVGRKGYYRCAGVGGNIVGLGFDVGIIDDPIRSREDADSPTVREAAWNWYCGDFYTRRAPGARILVIMTRWHPEDLAGKLLATMQNDDRADRWAVLKLPAICEEGPTETDPRRPGEALWPDRYPVEELEKTKAASPYEWDSQYRQHPRNPGSQEWPDELFPPTLWFDDWPPDLPQRVLALDPSKGRSDKSGDYSAFVMLGLDRDWTLWVDADLARRPVEAQQERNIVGDGLDIVRAWRPQAFSVEINGFQELVANAFIRVAEQKRIHLPLYGVNSTNPKPVRIRAIGPYLAQHRLRVRNTPGGRLLVEQLKLFPNADHDDGPDALAQAITMLDHLLGTAVDGDKPVLLTA